MNNGMGTSGYEDDDVSFGMCPHNEEESEEKEDPRYSGLNFNCLGIQDVEEELDTLLRGMY